MPLTRDYKKTLIERAECDPSFVAALLDEAASLGELGSENVYADLGLPDAAEMLRKSTLAAEIGRAIKARHLTQDQAAVLLGIDQAKLSQITRGQFRGVSETELHDLVSRLGAP